MKEVLTSSQGGRAVGTGSDAAGLGVSFKASVARGSSHRS